LLNFIKNIVISYFLAKHEFTAYRVKVYLSTISVHQCDLFFKRR